ncbi:PP2C family protein-serine/threonine phosphatase [Streptomyces sp. NBC_00344]|uniref:PP2C family protein-serine/threonine phosphatase n=1 Tax=Streptomyces sp. NBC_00344 TaxID=2975720 RepID=UPI002E1AE2CC
MSRAAQAHQHDHRTARMGTARAHRAAARNRPRIDGRLFTVLPALIVSAVALLALVGGAGMICLPLLVVGPALAAALNRPYVVLAIGLLAVALGAVLGVRSGAPGAEQAIVLSALAAVILASSLESVLRCRRERILADVRSVAEAAQHALLRPVPSVVGDFQVAVRYSAAAAEARIGGDLYALVPTQYGIRLIVGDVRGKGLPAVGTAALVLGVFREAAYDEPDLVDVVARIERSLARNLGADDFVTAVVVGYPGDGTMEVVNCGHVSPLLVSARGITAVETARPAPPLGLGAIGGEPPSVQVLPFTDGDQLLLYTDGVTEARDQKREFYPLTERLAEHLSDDPHGTLDPLHQELLAYVGGRLHDDAALLLVRKPHAAVPAPEAGAAAPVPEAHAAVPALEEDATVPVSAATVPAATVQAPAGCRAAAEPVCEEPFPV